MVLVIDWKSVAGETGVVEKWFGMVVGCNSDTEGGVEIGSTRWMVEMKV